LEELVLDAAPLSLSLFCEEAAEADAAAEDDDEDEEPL
jgi:hypothetical protein